MSNKPAQQISTVRDTEGTRVLRAKILQSDTLSAELAHAVGDVFKKHGVVPDSKTVITMEPVVTKIVEDREVQSIHPGSTNKLVSSLPHANIHIVETRSLVRNYAITSSAWNG